METTQLNWIDTHCHLYTPEFDDDQHEMIQRALASGVTKMMLPNIDESTIPAMWALVNQYPDHCMPMIGLHPCSVKENYRDVLEIMDREIKTRQYIGIGETGIDLFWDKIYKREQIEAFEQQILWAKTYNLPVIIHSRESLDLTIEIITQYQDGHLRGIFHCFSGDPEQIRKIEHLGFKVGIGGVVTYKKAGLAELLPQIPLKMIVLETDSPYLPPVPHRGKRNEPSFLVSVARRIADELGIPLTEVARVTTENAEAVYGKKV